MMRPPWRLHLTLAGIVGVVVATRPAPAQQTGEHADSTGHLRWAEVVTGIGAVAAATTIDGAVANAFAQPRSAGSLTTARQLDRFGDLTGELPIVGGLALAGLVAHDRRLDKAAWRATASIALAAIGTQAIKHVFGRLRPVDDADLDGYDFHAFTANQSFPSGHTAAAFALATSLGDAIGHRWARVGLYGLAAGTAWARMEEHEHWFSDVLAGAMLGVVSGKWASGKLRVVGVGAPRFLLGPRSLGVILPMPSSVR